MRYIDQEKREPTIGSIRVIQKFLMFPKTINGETRKWETSLIKQRAERRTRHSSAPEGIGASFYDVVEWIDKEWAD
jgi:hypothetical protein